MIRTQIYLTEQENAAIAYLSKKLGNGKSEIIRQAIDEFIERRDTSSKMKRLRSARGIWTNKADIPDIGQLRKDFDRF
jgi:metal-responsive CopG/Arc/MetJ family transcriptional regulator